MNILITGGCGFLGVRLARTLLALDSLSLAGGAVQNITQITLADRAAPPEDLAHDPRIVYAGGDLIAQLESRHLPAAGTALIFHLAAAVSGECEADFDLGMRSNLDATRVLLENCRALSAQTGSAPVLVFSSSLAVYGDTASLPLPAELDDATLPTPQSSYGVQKFIGEQLVADYTRKGFVQGRSVRLMTVSVRPGRPNGAASSFLSGMLREPLNGQRAICPVPASTAVVLSSPARAIEGLLCAAQTADAAWGSLTAMNLPGLMTTVGEMAQALEVVGGAAASALLDWQIDPKIERIISSWPRRMRTDRAAALGLRPDASFEQVVRDYVRENPQAVTITAAG